jgi:hypothetical protein
LNSELNSTENAPPWSLVTKLQKITAKVFQTFYFTALSGRQDQQLRASWFAASRRRGDTARCLGHHFSVNASCAFVKLLDRHAPFVSFLARLLVYHPQQFSVMSSEQCLLPRSSTADYEFLEKLGRGNSGTVFKVRKRSDKKFYVVKQVQLPQYHHDYLRRIRPLTLAAGRYRMCFCAGADRSAQ